MTEQGILRHAKSWLEQLVEGIDPLTGEAVSEDDTVRKERIRKCLSYISGVLEQLIARGGLEALPAGEKTQLPVFSITKEALGQVQISPTPVTVTEFVKRINAQIDQEKTDKLKTSCVLAYLEDQSLLEMRPLPNGRSTRQPTEAGRRLGIGLEDRQNDDGPYTATVYNDRAQSFLLAHMEEITVRNTAKYNETVEGGAMQGAPWTRDQDAQLRILWQRGASPAEIARTMQRSTKAIQARLQRLGLRDSANKT